MDIFNTIEAEGGPRQPVCVAINRSDYMLHAPDEGVTPPHLLQVSSALETCLECMRRSTAMAGSLSQQGDITGDRLHLHGVVHDN